MTTAAAPPVDLGRLWTLPGVYAPQADTYLLAQALHAEGLTPDMDVLDVCTGSGALALQAARKGARVCAIDISLRAVMTARMNAARAGHRVRVLRGDLTGPVAAQSFDVVVSNPPYVPTPHARRSRSHGPQVAWDAGLCGRQALDRICAHAPGLLRPNGVLLLVHSGLCDVEETLARLTANGLRSTVTSRALVPFGPVMTQRLPWLRAQGLIGADEDAEELVVVRAERS
ncbi:methyltransferase domain-containing protein [Streptomyces sp. A0958]|uniref:HemK2/MTQ2 family protein methyltransferase n=1 Tax=Streptomyces sp. A0958 TaxID=2563101 RepID=UPI00109EC18A|nr:HemK2/MTQ2 family protein methyltransferase [Streptomyces sp. A0958]THA63463.1 methyltransferase domain-containing protein [Streptomyces sp. A0958]